MELLLSSYNIAIEYLASHSIGRIPYIGFDVKIEVLTGVSLVLPRQIGELTVINKESFSGTISTNARV